MLVPVDVEAAVHQDEAATRPLTGQQLLEHAAAVGCSVAWGGGWGSAPVQSKCNKKTSPPSHSKLPLADEKLLF